MRPARQERRNQARRDQDAEKELLSIPLDPKWTPEATALHEASHAVTAVILQEPLNFTEIVRRVRIADGALGRVATGYAGFTEPATAGRALPASEHYKLALVGAASIALDARIGIPLGTDLVTGKYDDYEGLPYLARNLFQGRAIVGTIADFPGLMVEWAGRLLDQDCVMDAIHEVAAQLVLRKRLTGDEVQEIVSKFPAPVLPDFIAAVCQLGGNSSAVVEEIKRVGDPFGVWRQNT
jgi:hypothetical protein